MVEEDSSTFLLLAADALLLLHVIFVAFVVFSLVFIIIGKPLHWSWVRNPWFRTAHLSAIALVVVQSWSGIICPLTTWEMALRAKAGAVVYADSFIAHWLEKVLFYEAPMWVFIVCYTAFGTAVLASWYFVRPRPFTKLLNS